MDVERARYVVSDRGRAARVALPSDLPVGDPVALSATLRRLVPAFEASALAEQLTLSRLAAGRFGEPPLPFYSPGGLEMLTHPLVAARRAARLATLDLPLLDLTCGIGGDLAALAATGQPVAGIDRDPVACILAAANVPAAGVALADATQPPFQLEAAAAVIDPTRRDGDRRVFAPERFTPPWSAVLALARRARAAAVKTAPGIDHDAIPPVAETEFVQVGRVLREATAWLGGDAVPGLRRAVHLPSGATLDSTMEGEDSVASAPGACIVDPESCVTRAGLVQQLARELGARLLDSRIAYLTCDHPPPPTPLAAAFAVLDVLPFSVSRLKARLREGGWRPVEVRRRAFPVEPDDLRRQLGRLDGRPVVLLCTTLGDDRIVVVGEPAAANVQGHRQ